jgi:hypothetical protein
VSIKVSNVPDGVDDDSVKKLFTKSGIPVGEMRRNKKKGLVYCMYFNHNVGQFVISMHASINVTLVCIQFSL